MEKTARRYLTAPLALSITIALAGCGGSESDSSSDDTRPAATAPGSSESATAEQGTPGAEQSPSPSTGSTPADGGTTALGLTAIATAEAAAGGQAYQIDDLDDDKIWEVDVRVGLASIEVAVSGDGTQVYSQEGKDLDDDLESALAGATVTLSEVIQIAVEDSGGMLREVELEDATDAQPPHWAVSLKTGQSQDTEVHVSLTGEVTHVDD